MSDFSVVFDSRGLKGCSFYNAKSRPQRGQTILESLGNLKTTSARLPYSTIEYVKAKVVMKKSFDSKSMYLDLSNNVSGIYIVKLIDDNGVKMESKKLVLID